MVMRMSVGVVTNPTNAIAEKYLAVCFREQLFVVANNGPILLAAFAQDIVNVNFLIKPTAHN